MLRQIAVDQAYLRMIGRVSIAGIPVQFIGTKDADPRMLKADIHSARSGEKRHGGDFTHCKILLALCVRGCSACALCFRFIEGGFRPTAGSTV